MPRRTSKKGGHLSHYEKIDAVKKIAVVSAKIKERSDWRDVELRLENMSARSRNKLVSRCIYFPS